MNKKEALKRYTTDDILHSTLINYKDADEFFIVNDDDPDLKPIKISLPTPPDWHRIDNWSLPADDQIFKKFYLPEKLKTLKVVCEKKLKKDFESNRSNVVTEQKVINRMWHEIETNKKDYVKEIHWLKRFTWFRIYGYWVFINGKPTFIPPKYFKYLNAWSIKQKKEIQYRDANRIDQLFRLFAKTCTQDANGIDLHRRTCMGVAKPKVRQYGSTNMSECDLIDEAEIIKDAEVGQQSYNKDNSKAHYTTKVLYAFKNYPFFLKPMWLGSSMPQTGLTFSSPPYIYGDEVGSMLTYATTSSLTFYNGKTPLQLLIDEAARTKEEDILIRHDAYKECVSKGAGKEIQGFLDYPSTVVEADEVVIKQWKKLCDASKFDERNELGTTESGLFVYFLPSDLGFQGFIGKFGESISGTPTPEQAKFINSKIGARQHIQNTLNEYLKTKNYSGYFQFRLQHPLYYGECFSVGEGNTGFNTVKITQQSDRVSRMIAPTVAGNFKWDTGSEVLSAKEYLERNLHRERHDDHNVIWLPDAENVITPGRVELSISLPKNQTNCKEWNRDKGYYYPTFSERGIVAVDCFAWLDKQTYKLRDDKSRLSLGGGCGFLERDYNIDPKGKDPLEFQTYRPVADYYTRPDDSDEFAEEMLMMAIWLGFPLYPENNIKDVLKWVTERGYAGFLLYGTDSKGNMKEVPGYTTTGESKQELFKYVQTYIENYFHLCKHRRIISEVKEIKNKEDMTNHDLFAAFAGCLHGSRNRARFDDVMKQRTTQTQTMTFDSWHRGR